MVLIYKEEKTQIIKFKGKLQKVLYPQQKELLGAPHQWCITLWSVENIDGETTIFEWSNKKVVGVFPFSLEDNVTYTLLVKEEDNEKYGLQFRLISIIEEVDLSQISNQKAFLKRVLTVKQIENFYEMYDNPLEIIVNKDTESILKVKGIGPSLIEKIYERFDMQKDKANLFVKLEEYELTDNMIEKLLERYQSVDVVIKKVKYYPYDLVSEVKGVGFKTADQIALKSGISPFAPERIMGFINYLLEEKAQEGNSFLYADELTQEIFLQFGGKENILETYYNENNEVTGNNITVALDKLQKQNVLVIENNDNKRLRRIYLRKYYVLEQKIAMHLKRLLYSNNQFEYGDWEARIKRQEEKQGWDFTEEQRKGIKLGLDKQVCFITGLAGCGKSSLVSGILTCLKGYQFTQCSLSGKAAARLKEVTGEEGYTIHRLLGYNPADGKFAFNENNPLSYDIVIVDEISLIGGEIFLSLLEAIPNGAKLIVLGDMGQLESIGCMNLASDMYNSPIIPKAELTKVHRQAQKSGILTSSHSVRRGEQLFEINYADKMILGELQDMIIDIVPKEEIVDKILGYFEEYYDRVNHDIMRMQLIAPVKERGDSCVANLNRYIQAEINPKTPTTKFLVMNNTQEVVNEIRKNDKVMCIKNMYDVSCKDEDKKIDIFNGWTGIITDIDTKYGLIYIWFPLGNDTVILTKDEVRNNVVLGYVCTAHKMQGSSAEVIIGVLDYSTPPMMLTKELLYTMITRAEKTCVIVGQNQAIRKAIDNSGISNKKTFLQELLVKDIWEEL